MQDFIRTHHGTTYTGYFYAKELERHPDGNFDKSLFRYPGPRPYSRETAVVMIVDTVEAACRSLKVHSNHLRRHRQHPQVPQGEDDEHLPRESGIPDGEELKGERLRIMNYVF